MSLSDPEEGGSAGDFVPSLSIESVEGGIRVIRDVVVCRDLPILVNIMLMENSCYIWVGGPESTLEMPNLSAAMQTKYESMPICSHLLSPDGDGGGDWGGGIAQKLAKRLKGQLFVSCALPPSYEEAIPELERALLTMLTPIFVSK